MKRVRLASITAVMLLTLLLFGLFGSRPEPAGARVSSSAALQSASCTVTAPPASLGLDPFYTKYCSANGFPVIASSVVPDAAVIRAWELVMYTTQNAQYRQALINNRVRFGVIGVNQVITDMPEYRNLYTQFPGTDWNTRARGLGATSYIPLASAAEENLLCYSSDRYRGEDITIHEFSGHTIKGMGIEYVDSTFRSRVQTAYNQAIAQGLWANTYAGSNAEEYWAEGVQGYFNVNAQAIPTNGVHNFVNTRSELQAYDPTLYNLIRGIFGDISTLTLCSSPPTVTTTPVTSTPIPPPSQNPVVWYRFDATSGTTAVDSSGNNRTATLVNGPTWVAGQSGNAVNLDGSNDYVSMPSGIVSGLNDFTIATWVRLDTTGSWRRLFDFGTGTSVNMFLIPTSGSTIRFAITTSGSGGEQRINGTAALPTGVWQHVAVTLSGNTGRLYVDGVQVGQNTSMTLRPSSLGNTSNNWLGRSQYSGDAYLDGLVDDFRIYNRGLSAAEVQTLVVSGPTLTPTNTGTPTSTPTPTPTGSVTPLTELAWYKLDETSGTTAADSSGNGRNATLVNGPTWVAGKIGNAVNLDGSNDYVSLPAGIVSGLNDFTIATWVKLDTTGSWRRIFDFGSSTSANMFLVPTSGSTIRFAITTGGAGGEQRINGTAALPTGVWKHVAVTLSGNTGRLYVDGVQVGQNTNMTLRPSSLGNTSNNWLGRSQYSGDAYLDGQIDQLRIFSRALSASEVQALFQTP